MTLVARLVPIKRVDRFLETAALLRDRPGTRFVVVGDGELRQELQSSPPARALGDRLLWGGFRRDMPDVCFASDVVVLTSDNEGTPVSLIEAQAARRRSSAPTPAVCARSCSTARPATWPTSRGARGAHRARCSTIASAPSAMAARGRDHVLSAFGIERLVDDLDRLYRRLLG